jgi:hypothetical protein
MARPKTKSGGDGRENTDTKGFIGEPPPATVTDYARQRMHVMLDTQLPAVKLDSILGVQCQKAVDAAAELQRVATLLCAAPETPTHMIRLVVRELLTAALTRPLRRPEVRAFAE